MNCGKLIADKWRAYQKQLNTTKGETRKEERVYFDGITIPETIEKRVLDTMGIIRPCCRKHFLTQVDLIDKI